MRGKFLAIENGKGTVGQEVRMLLLAVSTTAIMERLSDFNTSSEDEMNNNEAFE